MNKVERAAELARRLGAGEEQVQAELVALGSVAVPRLIELVRDGTREAAEAAIVTLGRIGDPAAYDVVLDRTLGEKDPDACVDPIDAAIALRSINVARAAAGLAERLAPPLREEAVMQLELAAVMLLELDPERLVEVGLRALAGTASDAWLDWLVGFVVDATRRPAALARLEALVEHEEEAVGLRGVAALVRADPRVRPDVRAVLERLAATHVDPAVADAAAQGLRACGITPPPRAELSAEELAERAWRELGRPDGDGAQGGELGGAQPIAPFLAPRLRPLVRSAAGPRASLDVPGRGYVVALLGRGGQVIKAGTYHSNQVASIASDPSVEDECLLAEGEAVKGLPRTSPGAPFLRALDACQALRPWPRDASAVRFVGYHLLLQQGQAEPRAVWLFLVRFLFEGRAPGRGLLGRVGQALGLVAPPPDRPGEVWRYVVDAATGEPVGEVIVTRQEARAKSRPPTLPA